MSQQSQYRKVLTYARAMRQNPTPAEQFFWEKARNRAIMGQKFYRQYVIQHAEILGKRSFFIADFYCHEAKLIIELDGPIHQEQQEYDQIRQSILEEMGYQVVRFSNEEVLEQWEGVKEKIKGILENAPY